MYSCAVVLAVGRSAGLLFAQPGTQPLWLRSGLCDEPAPALLPTTCTHDQYSLAILASLVQQHLMRILTGACLCAGATVSPTRPSRRRSMALLVNHRGEPLEDGSSYNNKKT